MNTLIQYAFRQFYTTFAWTYDAVANLVSFGEWQQWGQAAIPFLPREGRLLEIAHGPGHLHLALRQQGFDAVGMDLSMPMCRLLHARLIDSSIHLPQQARASALRLPFADQSFKAVVSTFPAGFIFARDTLNEVHRILQPGGRFVIVPTARFTDDGLPVKIVELAYRLTGQRRDTPSHAVEALFASAGFAFEEHTVRTQHAKVTVWVCTKPGDGQSAIGEP